MNAASRGANNVNGPVPASAPSRPACFSAAVRMENRGSASTTALMLAAPLMRRHTLRPPSGEHTKRELLARRNAPGLVHFLPLIAAAGRAGVVAAIAVAGAAARVAGTTACAATGVASGAAIGAAADIIAVMRSERFMEMEGLCVVMPTSWRASSRLPPISAELGTRVLRVVTRIPSKWIRVVTTLPHMFHDRQDAGRRLALRLEHLSGKNTLVLGLPRGGVPVAYEVAKTLHAPLDVLIVRKLGVPWHPELAFGAVGEGGVRVLNDDVIQNVGLHDNHVAAVEARERHEVAARTAVIVDDGVATGATAAAACSIARLQGAKHVVLAVPSAPSEWAKEHSDIADEVVVYDTHLDLGSVGAYYEHFEQVDDATVERLLREARETTFSGNVRVPANETEWMEGRLKVPFGARGMVVFSHGSGSSRLSPRNQQVAERLNAAGFATLLFDLLVPEEARVEANRFDIELLSRRLGATVPWIRSHPLIKHLPIGFFGASTGAAAAIVAATRHKGEIRAVVSRGGRPDLAGSYLGDLQIPTLFVVGGADTKVLELNREAIAQLNGPYSLSVVHGATHLFEEPGAMENVVDEAVAYFAEHLA